MIDLRTFSLGKMSITIERYTGRYSAGIYIYEKDKTFSTWASVQPYKTIEADRVFEPESGERVDNTRIMFTNEKIYINDGLKTQTRDIIIINDEQFKPIKVEVWQHLDLPHYRSILRVFDGN